jgi:hypothetical protein
MGTHFIITFSLFTYHYLSKSGFTVFPLHRSKLMGYTALAACFFAGKMAGTSLAKVAFGDNDVTVETVHNYRSLVKGTRGWETHNL